MNGMIIVIFIILYIAFKFLKAKDSEDNSSGYSKQPYNPVYPRNRVVPPKEDLSGRFKDEGESWGDKTFEEKSCGNQIYGEKTCEDKCYKDKGKDENESYEAEPYVAETIENIGDVNAKATGHIEKADEVEAFDITADYKMPEVPAPEAIGLTMPEPMSMPIMEIVIDSDVHVDTTLTPDKHKE